MLRGALTGYVDVAQVALYVFWGFFFGLVLYLIRENHREGYPLVSEVPGQVGRPITPGFPPVDIKFFRLYHGGIAQNPGLADPRNELNARPAALFPGAPIEPLGDPFLDGIGPAAWAVREDLPDLTIDGAVKFRPMRDLEQYSLDPRTPNPIGWPVVGADNIVAGHVIDVWIDEVENEVVYLELQLSDPLVGPVLVPQTFVRFRARTSTVSVRALLASQFEFIPRTRLPNVTTRLEEDRILAYFGGGALFATPARRGPLL
ncbi:photosynthetic reaction center subunit H [Lichenicola sp.]|uniref:photosynthetic reaction center subunit H n=1 Tax=Lichenicola sp. TaxID=2804529 RepID=UPI003AFFDF5A